MDQPTKDQLRLVTLLATVQILHETLDDLEGTLFYKQKFKQEVIRFDKSLSKTCDHLINKMWDLDEGTMVAMQLAIENISKEMAKMSPARMAAIGELFRQTKIEWSD